VAAQQESSALIGEATTNAYKRVQTHATLSEQEPKPSTTKKQATQVEVSTKRLAPQQDPWLAVCAIWFVLVVLLTCMDLSVYEQQLEHCAQSVVLGIMFVVAMGLMSSTACSGPVVAAVEQDPWLLVCIEWFGAVVVLCCIDTSPFDASMERLVPDCQSGLVGAVGTRLAWVDWQQLESAYGSGYLD
jgi:hypothetical protein